MHGDADLVGKTLGDSGLRDRDITVLTLHRGTTVIPNPFNAPRAGGRGPAALLRQARGDALDDSRRDRKRRARVKKLPKQPIHPEA